ncbi:MAG: MFS transporter [Planctomycetota bacterium]|jgi:MFS family permease
MSPERPAPFDPQQRRQLLRFCLYGFLKNQQYYEPFLILCFLDRGLSFAQIGALVAFRSVCVNLLEIPSGAAADVWGRRRSMICSMLAYVMSFAVFAFARAYWTFFPAMLLFAAGEAFRTGTHKAMIFGWLSRQGREGEKTRVYGLTRSWSKLGSALSVVLAAAVVILTRDYRWVFLLAALPYVGNVVNFLFYPKYLDGEAGTVRSPLEIGRVLFRSLGSAFTKKQLRGLMVESMCFGGLFAATKDYLQPLIKVVAVGALAGLALFSGLDDLARTAVLVAAVYLPLNLAGSFASRSSHRLAGLAGDEDRLASFLWVAALLLYLASGLGLVAGWGALAVIGFVLLAVIQNVWRPALVSRFHSHAELSSAATTLSVESQGKSLATALAAPVIGLAVDFVAGRGGEPLFSLWPAAAAGVLACLVGLVMSLLCRRGHPAGEPSAGTDGQIRP